MSHTAFHFQLSVRNPSRTAASDFVIPFPDVGPEDQVCRPRFVFQCYKSDALGRRWPLPKNDQACNSQLTIVRFVRQFSATGNAQLVKRIPMERQRVGPQRQSN